MEVNGILEMTLPIPEMTLPRQLRLLLIAEPSFNVSPVAPVLSARSDPARSTRLISEVYERW